MPRPREFDTETALDAALDEFWREGYEATTLTGLTAAMGISKPSLYNAFGDKEALFLAVLDRYADGYRASLAAMDDEPNAREAIRVFLVGVARSLARPSGPSGCLRVSHTARAGDHEPTLAAALADAHRAFEAAFVSRLERAQRDGQLSPVEDSVELGAFFAGVVSAMSVRGRVDPDEDVLVGMAERSLRAWPVA